MSHFFAVLFRMRNIDRWSLMRNMFRENLSVHTLEVAVIAHALAVITDVRFGGNADPGKAAAAALFHDAPEIITGDLPTPVKYYNDEIKTAYKKIEGEAKESLLSLLPGDLRGAYAECFDPDDETREIVRAADKLQALIKCRDELNLGNGDFASAEASLREAVASLTLPAARVFAEEFMPSFSLPLDAQTPGQSPEYRSAKEGGR